MEHILEFFGEYYPNLPISLACREMLDELEELAESAGADLSVISALVEAAGKDFGEADDAVPADEED